MIDVTATKGSVLANGFEYCAAEAAVFVADILDECESYEELREECAIQIESFGIEDVVCVLCAMVLANQVDLSGYYDSRPVIAPLPKAQEVLAFAAKCPHIPDDYGVEQKIMVEAHLPVLKAGKLPPCNPCPFTQAWKNPDAYLGDYGEQLEQEMRKTAQPDD